MTSYRLRKWDPTAVAGDKTILVIGKRGSGKSVAIADIMYSVRTRIPAAVVFSGTEESNGHFGRFVPREYVYPEFNALTMEKIMQRQRDLIRRGTPSPICVVLDDCAYDKRFFSDKTFRFVMLNGRHLRLFTIVSQQYALDTPPYARANFDYVIVFRDPIASNRERLYKQFFGIFPNQAAFNDVFSACTEDFEALVLDQTSRSNKVEDTVFWWKAKLRKPFRFGSDAYWLAARSLSAAPRPQTQQPQPDKKAKAKGKGKEKEKVRVKKLL